MLYVYNVVYIICYVAGIDYDLIKFVFTSLNVEQIETDCA